MICVKAVELRVNLLIYFDVGSKNLNTYCCCWISKQRLINGATLQFFSADSTWNNLTGICRALSMSEVNVILNLQTFRYQCGRKQILQIFYCNSEAGDLKPFLRD